MSASNTRTCLSLAIAALLLNACGGGSDTDDTPADVRGVNNTYLFVSYQTEQLSKEGETSQSLYYGTQNVGTASSAEVRIANRGADIYPLKHIAVSGANADEFTTEILDDIILQPTEFVDINVTFQPITEGEKSADFVVDYETIQMVDESVNVNEQSYYEARDLETAGEFRAASVVYDEYLANDPVTVNKRRAAIRLPIIDEAQSYDAEEELQLYLQAMQHRDYKEYAEAIRKLDTMMALYPDSYMADDAQYLKGYIQLIDLDDPAGSISSMQAVRSIFPDTTYYDSSLYSEAVAQLELGNASLAETILLDIRARHTGIDALGIQLPKDNLLSRMWFERSSTLLESV